MCLATLHHPTIDYFSLPARPADLFLTYFQGFIYFSTERFVKTILGMGQQTQNSGETLPSPSFYFGSDKSEILGRCCALEQSGPKQRHQPRMMNVGPC